MTDRQQAAGSERKSNDRNVSPRPTATPNKAAQPEPPAAILRRDDDHEPVVHAHRIMFTRLGRGMKVVFF